MPSPSRPFLASVIAVGLLALAPAHIQAQRPAAGLALIPIPREIHAAAAQPIPDGLTISCRSCASNSEDAFTLQDLNASLSSRSIPTSGPFTVQLLRTDSLPAEMQAEGYAITPGPNSLTLSATSSAGLFYAAQTLKQLILDDGAKAVLRTATIRDWPAMKYRGMHDDLSRGPIPTLAFQKHLVQTLAAYKINLYSPYFENTQQYLANPLFAPPGGSISPTEARELTAFAAQYHVTVVPEQEAFGHLHHNLLWEQYQPLAETPHGAVLAPGQPGSLALIQSMFTELAADYPGPFLHIGADETVDLGTGQTKADVDSRGLGPVYLDFLGRITSALAPLHRRLLFWGDIAQEVTRTDPNLLKNLPSAFKQNTIAVAWWYTPQLNGFARFLTPFTSAGFETWVSPGVNNWSVVWPDNNDALPNIQQFTAEGQRQHSTGALNTVWYDDGEALANNNWYGLLFGAAAAWQSGTSSIDVFQQSFGQNFHGDSTGALNQAQVELMKCHAILRNDAKVGDGSDGLFWMDPWSKDGQPRASKLRPFSHDLRLHAEAAITLIAKARAANNGLHNSDAIDALELGARRLDFIGLKFQLADEIVQGYGKALIAQVSTDKKLHAQTGPLLSDIRGINGRLRDLVDTYALLRDLYQQAWLRSNRNYSLTPVLARYDQAIQLWLSRDDRFRAAQRQYQDQKTLPSPTDLGLPPRSPLP